MKIAFSLAGTAAALVLAGGCETFSEPIMLERQVLLERNGMLLVEDVEEDPLSGNRHVQYTAFNFSDRPYCTTIQLDRLNYSQGHAFGEIYRIDPGAEIDIAYVLLPADFSVRYRTWGLPADGQCGYAPPG